MISVVIPTLDAERHLERTPLHSLFQAAMEGMVSEVIVVDGGSRDADVESRGQMARGSFPRQGTRPATWAGAAEAPKPWLLFLHADTQLEPGWEEDAEHFMAQTKDRAAVFRFRLADKGLDPASSSVALPLRCALFWPALTGIRACSSPGRSTTHWAVVALRIMEDVDLVRRLGRKRLRVLDPMRSPMPWALPQGRAFSRRVSAISVVWQCSTVVFRRHGSQNSTGELNSGDPTASQSPTISAMTGNVALSRIVF